MIPKKNFEIENQLISSQRLLAPSGYGGPVGARS